MKIPFVLKLRTSDLASMFTALMHPKTKGGRLTILAASKFIPHRPQRLRHDACDISQFIQGQHGDDVRRITLRLRGEDEEKNAAF